MLSGSWSSRYRTIARVVVAAALVVAAEGLSTSAAAATAGSPIWAKRYNGPGSYIDGARADAVSPDGSTVFVAGYVYHSLTGYDYGTVAYDASTGAVGWTKRYNGPADSSDLANAVAVSPDGSTVFVTGYSYSSTSNDYATVAYDASSGARLWARRYDGPGNGDDAANALGVSPNGAQVFVTGQSRGSTSAHDYATVAYDASTGGRLWAERYNGPRNAADAAKALAVSPNGAEVLVTGQSRGSTSGFDYATIAYGADDGVQRWIKRYDGPSDVHPFINDDAARSVGVSPDSSRVFVTGYSYRSTTGFDYTTIAYDASTGAKLWLKLHDGPGSFTDQANALAVSPDGSSVLVTGYDYASATGSDYATVAYDASTGAQLWAKRYVGSVVATDQAKDVGVSPDSSTVIVTGYSYSSETTNGYATIAYDASTGAKLWAKRYNNGGASSDSVATALDVSASAVLVTGYSSDPSSSSFETDYATIAYALT